MSSFITGLIGIAAVLAALFCAFAFGFAIEKPEPNNSRELLAATLILAFAGILLLLVRS